ncbi:MAG: iron-sulfur cluster assembly scaffold protein [Deltaproteobacteria bacterium]|nr:iron-sulfur cluster assembly scaffold protein [Deltaproteobacteria bacterium]
MTKHHNDHWKEFEDSLYRLSGKSYGTHSEPPTPKGIGMGRLPDASSSASVTGPCGESIEIYLKVKGERIEKTSFYTDGCGASVLCGYAAALLARGKTIDDAAGIDADTILDTVGNLPDDHRHCAMLAAETLRIAIHNYLAKPRFREHLPEHGKS